MFGLSTLSLRIIGVALICAGTLGLYGQWAHHIERRGFDRAAAIYERQLADLAHQATAQSTAHRAQMRAAEVAATKTIADTRNTLKARQNELRKINANLATCSLSLDTIRVLNRAAQTEPSPTPN